MRPWRRGSATARSNGSGCTDAGRISRRWLTCYSVHRGSRTFAANEDIGHLWAVFDALAAVRVHRVAGGEPAAVEDEYTVHGVIPGSRRSAERWTAADLEEESMR